MAPWALACYNGRSVIAVRAVPGPDLEDLEAMGTRLYVGNLPYSMTEEELRSLFEADGRSVADVHIPMDRETGRPRGFAFVEMKNDADAQAAIEAMDGAQAGGRTLRVNEAQERDRGGGGGRGPRGRR